MKSGFASRIGRDRGVHGLPPGAVACRTSADAQFATGTDIKAVPAMKAAGRTPRGRTRRDELVSEVASILLRDGLEGVSIDQIALKAKASKATIYRHFGSRVELIQEAVDFLCHSFHPNVDLETADSLDLRLESVLSNIASVVLTEEYSSFFRTVVCSNNVTPEIARIWYETGPQIWQRLLRRSLANASREGLLSECLDLNIYSELLFNVVFSAAITRVATDVALTPQRGLRSDHAYDLAMRALSVLEIETKA